MIDLSTPELLDLIDACETHRRLLDTVGGKITDLNSQEWRDHSAAVLRLTKLTAKLRHEVAER